MPKTKIFKYNKKIDSDIILAIAEVLKVKVKKAIKMKHGEVNHTYKIITEEGNFLARIFKNKAWPEKGKLQWIEKQLVKYKIRHAKILYYSSRNNFFPYGFMVTEFLDGCNGNQAVKRKQISFADAFIKTGEALKKIHKIKIKKFGKINNGNGENSSFITNKLNKVKERIERLEKSHVIKPGLFSPIEKRIKVTFGQFDNQLFAVLNHADANRENAIFTSKREWVLIDWDNAYSGIWVEDYTELTYWVDWDRKPAHAKRVHALIKRSFFKGYGAHNFSDDQIIAMENVLHILKATNMMIYYYFTKNSLIEFKKTRNKFYKLLESE
jgi:Ser/Thr protein kinase RdoA (MazF antagonist)